MNLKNTLSIVLIIFLFSTACKKEEQDVVTPIDVTQIELSEKGKQIVEADNKFGFELFKNIVQNEIDNKNIMISSTSIALALAMTYNGAGGTTKNAMEETLNKSGLSPEEINTSYQTLIHALETVDDKVILSIANSIWYRNDFSVLPDFITTNENYYDAEVSALDFNNPNAKNIINAWVAENTKDKIKKIVDNISSDAVMFLINAIYFKGIWHYKFDESQTTEQDFTLADGSQTFNVAYV